MRVPSRFFPRLICVIWLMWINTPPCWLIAFSTMLPTPCFLHSKGHERENDLLSTPLYSVLGLKNHISCSTSTAGYCKTSHYLFISVVLWDQFLMIERISFPWVLSFNGKLYKFNRQVTLPSSNKTLLCSRGSHVEVVLVLGIYYSDCGFKSSPPLLSHFVCVFCASFHFLSS